MDYKKQLTEKQRERFAFMLRYKRLERFDNYRIS